MLDLNSLEIGKPYECGNRTLQEAKSSIIENGHYEFEDKTRVKGFGNGMFDFYEDKVIRVK